MNRLIRQFKSAQYWETVAILLLLFQTKMRFFAFLSVAMSTLILGAYRPTKAVFKPFSWGFESGSAYGI